MCITAKFHNLSVYDSSCCLRNNFCHFEKLFFLPLGHLTVFFLPYKVTCDLIKLLLK